MIKNVVLVLSVVVALASTVTLGLMTIGYAEDSLNQEKELKRLRDKLRKEKLFSEALVDQSRIIVNHVHPNEMPAILQEIDDRHNKLKFDQIVSQF